MIVTERATGGTITELRRGAGLTQARLAMSAGLHINSVKRLERFEFVPAESWFALGRVAGALKAAGAGIPAAWLNWRFAGKFPARAQGTVLRGPTVTELEPVKALL